MHHSIPDLENLFYLLTWISAVVYSVYCFSAKSYRFFQHFHDVYGEFSPGIPALSSKRDKSDLEWENLIYLVQHFFPLVLIYLFLAQLLCYNNSNRQVRSLWHILFTLFCIQYLFGQSIAVILFLLPLFFYCFRYLSRTTICTWTCCCLSIIFMTILGKNHVQVVDYLKLDYNTFYALSVSLGWMTLKCTSYYLERPQSESVIEILAYCLYPPTMVTGPFILYEDFQHVYDTSKIPVHERIFRLTRNVFKCMLWFLFTIVCLHFVYISAVTFQIEFINNLDFCSLCGFGYAMGQFFHIKYVIQYGLSTSVASFDNVTVPFLPRCIGRVHLYSDMWRYFDPGLYTFLLRHVYVPSLKITKSKILSSLLSFTFVFAWHGVSEHVLLWSVLNYIGIVLEQTSAECHKKYLSRHTERLGLAWERRLKCLAAAPLLAVSCISNFYFFGRKHVGDVFFWRFFGGKSTENAVLILLLYCCSQVSTRLRSLNSDKMG